jgi:hypothetical protein
MIASGFGVVEVRNLLAFAYARKVGSKEELVIL